MKNRILKAALIVASAMTMVFGATMVANAEEYFAKPRVASNCDNVNCQGHVSVFNGESGLNIYYCVPDSWTGSFDEYRTKAESYFEEISGVAAPKDYYMSPLSKEFDGIANLTEAQVDGADLVKYYAIHKTNDTCESGSCKANVFVFDASKQMHISYCVPANWPLSLDEYKVRMEEYLANKNDGVYEAPAAEEPAAPVVTEVPYTVVKGDTLSKIAKKAYGDSKLWKNIYEANKDTIKNPNVISIGQVIVLPCDINAPAPAVEEAATEEVAAPVVDVNAPASDEAMDLLCAQFEHVINYHNLVVDAVDSGARPMTEAGMNLLDAGSVALNELVTYEYTQAQAFTMYCQLANYANTLYNLK